MDSDTVGAGDRPIGTMSRMVGLYQTLLRRELEHFFPDASLDAGGDRSFIGGWDGSRDTAPSRSHYRVEADPEGLGVQIDWFWTCYTLVPGSPTPFLPSERLLIESVVRVLDSRFRALNDRSGGAGRYDLFQYALEDLVLTEYLGPPDPVRVPAALEAMRAAALSTYENRRVSNGVLLLGTAHDPAAPSRLNPEGAPRFNVRLTAIKGYHRLCDGVRTVFLVDRPGDLIRAVDIGLWAERVQGPEAPEHPCPRAYCAHAKATRSGGHICIVLTPQQEIKVFAGGTLAFAFSDARWRLLDIPTKFAAWTKAVGACRLPNLAEVLFQAALNLSEDRKGALFVVLRDPSRSIHQLIAPADRIVDEVAVDDPEDPDNLSPRLAKRSLHHAARGMDLGEIDPAVLEALASVDGAVVTDRDGRLLTFGAILRIDPEAMHEARAVEGARTLAALAASYHGPVLKVSEDGFVSMFLGGRRLWEL